MKKVALACVSIAFLQASIALAEVPPVTGQVSTTEALKAPATTPIQSEASAMKSIAFIPSTDLTAQQNYDRATQAAQALCAEPGEVAVLQDLQNLSFTSREVHRTAIPQVVYGSSLLYTYRRDPRGFFTNQDAIPLPERVVTIQRLQVQPKLNQQIIASVVCEKPALEMRPAEATPVLQAKEKEIPSTNPKSAQ